MYSTSAKYGPNARNGDISSWLKEGGGTIEKLKEVVYALSTVTERLLALARMVPSLANLTAMHAEAKGAGVESGPLQ